MAPPLVRAASFALVAALAASAARAQEAKDDPAKPASSAPAAGDAGSVLAQMEALHPKVLADPRAQAPGPDAEAKTKDAYGRRLDDWRADVRALAKASDAWLAAVGEGRPDARGLFLRGVAKTLLLEIEPRPDVPMHAAAAADALERWLGVADEKSDLRADAERHLGRALIAAKRVDDATPHLRRAVEALQKAGRHDDAGVSAWYAMAALADQGRDEELRSFADAVHAADADFGASTPTIRNFAARSQFAVGAPLPKMPAAKSVDGSELSFAPDGKPLLLHYFMTGLPDGTPTTTREVESEIKPLWEKHADKGLRVVGVCLDYEIPAAKAEQARKDWVEWGRKETFRDGTLASSRAWAKDHGVAWPWTWSGKWMVDPLSTALGGVGASRPFAVLVDGKGVVRWKGEGPPFVGLADEVAKLVP
jgi:hypothetical protein